MVVLARAQFEVSIFNGLFIWQVVRKRKEKREEGKEMKRGAGGRDREREDNLAISNR